MNGDVGDLACKAIGGIVYKEGNIANMGVRREGK